MITKQSQYNKLVSDIKIMTDSNFDIDSLSNKLTINNGTEYLDPLSEIAKDYAGESFIPKSTWRRLEIDELELLIADSEHFDVSSTIGIMQIPASKLALLQQTLAFSEGHFEINDKILYQQAIVQITNYLQAYCLPQVPIKSLGINSSFSGLVTTTRDEINYLPNKPHVGLHLDSFEKYPLKRRHLSHNRLCINIGEETRYFLFLNLSLMQIFRMLELRDPQDVPQYYRGIGLAELFFSDLS